MPGRLVIVVPNAEEEAIRQQLAELAPFNWQLRVRVLSGPVRRGRGQDAQAESMRILREANDFDADLLIVSKNICCDARALSGGHLLEVLRPSGVMLRQRLLKRKLEEMGLLWRACVGDQIARWNARKNDPDRWLGQFGDAKWLGEGLLRQLEVIDPGKLAEAFEMPAQASIGQKLVFSYVAEGDPASSSNRVGGLLAQMHEKGHTQEFSQALAEADSGSHLIVCEDALWTGFELRKLLSRLCAGGDLEPTSRGKRITFRHYVVTDFGILTVRHFLERFGLTNVDLSLGHKQRFLRVLPKEVDQSIGEHWSAKPEAFEDWLMDVVRPMAFSEPSIWGGKVAEAEQMCAEIGRQLIANYDPDQKRWRKEVHEKFSLGAAGFGSTLMFSHSVPKTCLPLFWLSGPIRFRSREISWEPLFFDARRVRRPSFIQED